MIENASHGNVLQAAIEDGAATVWLVNGETYFEGAKGRRLSPYPADPLWTQVSRLALGADDRADATKLLPVDQQADWLCRAYFGPDIDGRINAVLNLYQRNPPSLFTKFDGIVSLSETCSTL